MITEFDLDITTLSVITALFSFLYGFGMLAVSLKEKKYIGLKTYAYGLWTLGLGFTLMGLGYADILESIFITRLIAFYLILVSFIILNYGLSLFRQTSLRHVSFGSILFIAVVPILYFYIYVSPSVVACIAWISFFISIQSALCAYDLFRGNYNDLFIAKLLTAVPFIATSVYFLFRTFFVLAGSELINFLDAGALHQLSFLMICILILLSCFGLLWLISSRLNHDLKTQAKTDSLTSLYNRRYLDRIVSKEVKQASKRSTLLSIMMLDIDHFKALNDQYGHQVGDIVLAKIGKILQENTRIDDTPCRYGGEEFLIFLPNTSEEQAFVVADKVRNIIETTVFDTELNIKTTVSIGLSTLMPYEEWGSVIKRADENLYEAKRLGRNQVVF